MFFCSAYSVSERTPSTDNYCNNFNCSKFFMRTTVQELGDIADGWCSFPLTDGATVDEVVGANTFATATAAPVTASISDSFFCRSLSPAL